MSEHEPAPFELKKLSHEAIPRALERAKHLRTVREPQDAESICRDVLRVEPDNQEALVTLLLSLTDQFRIGSTTQAQAQRIIGSIHDEYKRWYYTGVAYERWAKAHHGHGVPDAVASEYFVEAMRAFEKAEHFRPPGNDDAILRWNACVRMIRADEYLKHKFERYSLYDDSHER